MFNKEFSPQELIQEIRHELAILSKNLEEVAKACERDQAPKDPCPNCIPDTYCRTPACGRLKIRDTVPKQSSVEYTKTHTDWYEYKLDNGEVLRVNESAHIAIQQLLDKVRNEKS